MQVLSGVTRTLFFCLSLCHDMSGALVTFALHCIVWYFSLGPVTSWTVVVLGTTTAADISLQNSKQGGGSRSLCGISAGVFRAVLRCVALYGGAALWRAPCVPSCFRCPCRAAACGPIGLDTVTSDDVRTRWPVMLLCTFTTSNHSCPIPFNCQQPHIRPPPPSAR